MKFQLLNFDDKHYASNIVQMDHLLKWDALGNTHNLIIRAEYGAKILFTETEKNEIEKYANEQIFSGKEHRYSDDRFFAVVPKGYVNNYQFMVSPATYAVFCCDYDAESDVCKLYVPNDACLYQCSVSANIEVRITKEPVKTGWFSRKPKKQYYTVHIQTIPGYVEGSLHYTFDGCKYRYPVTKAMLGKDLSVPAFGEKAPRLDAALGGGYKIVVRNG